MTAHAHAALEQLTDLLGNRLLTDPESAQRYGVAEGLVDFGRSEVVPYKDLLEEMIALVEPDALHFGCLNEIVHARDILQRGTSADRQIARFEAARKDGNNDREALEGVVDGLIEETLAGVEP